MTSLKELLGLVPVGAEEVMTISEFLAEWANDSRLNANAAGRLLKAIGKPTLVDTSKDERLNRIFAGQTIRYYPGFSDFYGIEQTIQDIVMNLESAASGLIAGRRIQLFVGPPGSGKSSFTTRLRELAEKEPMYVLAVKEGDEYIASPVFESPLGVFQNPRQRQIVGDTYKIPSGRFGAPLSFWAAKHLERFGGDPTEFYVKKVMPSQNLRIGVAKVSPGNSKRGDLSALIGAAKDGMFVASGGLNVTTQGFLELVEMFGGDAASLEPLIGATQDDSYASLGFGELPHEGVIYAHTNEPVLEAYKKRGLNDALMSRVQEIRFPLCIRASEIEKIHRQYVARSGLRGVTITPHAFEVTAIVASLSRVKDASLLRARLYDGDRPPEGKEKEYAVAKLLSDAGMREGMGGASERDMFSVIDRALRGDPAEIGLDEVILIRVLSSVANKILSLEGKSLASVLKSDVVPFVNQRVRDVVLRTCVEKHASIANATATRYFELADILLDKHSGGQWKDPETDQVHDMIWIAQELVRIEHELGLLFRDRETRDEFRGKIVNKVLHHRAQKNDPSASVLDALDDSLRKKFDRGVSRSRPSSGATESSLPEKTQKELDSKRRAAETKGILDIIRFEQKSSKELEEKHRAFVMRMCAEGYTERQVRRFVDWFIEHKLGD